jgi:hypothetical protein
MSVTAQLLAMALVAEAPVERLTCAWPMAETPAKLNVVEFRVKGDEIVPVGDADSSLTFRNSWKLLQNDESSLIASAAITLPHDRTPTAFVTTLILNRRTWEAVVTTATLFEGRWMPTTTVRGNCRSLEG